MNTIFQFVPLVYLFFVIALCTFLLIRGITHAFVGLFACGAALQMVPHLGFLVLSEMAGGFAANSQYYPLLTLFAMLGLLCFAAGFVLLAKFLLGAGRGLA